jgi:predicted amidophosphoribosyltransferase
LNTIKLEGNWKIGWALGLHTISSVLLPDGSFHTERSPIGEKLYQLKYCFDKNQTNAIVDDLKDFMDSRLVTPYLSTIIPVPPSDETREFQPVYELARELGKRIDLPVIDSYIVKLKSTEQLKSVDDPEERKNILKGAFGVKDQSLQGKKVLLFDDLFRSGSTLRELTNVLYKKGLVQNVYVLTVTKTRVKK